MSRRASTAERLPELSHGSAPANDPTLDPGAFALPEMPPDAQVTLAMLVALFGAPDAACRATHLRGCAEETLLADGNQYDSTRVVDGAVAIVVATVRVLASLTPEQRDLVTLDPAIFAVIVHEAARLHAMLTRRAASAVRCTAVKAGHAAACASAHRDAIAQRDVVRVGLAQVLGAEADPDLTAAYDASDDAALARGLDALANALDDALAQGDAARRAQLARRRLDAARVHRLRALAAQLRATSATPSAAPEPAVRERELNVQDGRVLRLLDAVVDAMRAAHRADRAIEVPKFGPLARRYKVGVRNKKPAAPPPPVTP